MKVALLDFEKRGGLIPVIAQCVHTRRVLMLAYANKEAYLETLRTGRAVYFSTSRNSLWPKGEESGDFQIAKEIQVDCDLDAIIYLVEQWGRGACHTGAASCFFRNVSENGLIMPVPDEEKIQLPNMVDVETHSSFRKMFSR